MTGGFTPSPQDQAGLDDLRSWCVGQAATIICFPEPSDWQCHAAGITYVPEAGKEPNAFHRFMQRLAFGFRWERR